MKVIIRQYDSMESAQEAVAALREMGIADEQIGFLTRQGATEHFDLPTEMDPDDVGPAEGALFGGLTGLVTAVVAMATPLGPLIAAGPLFGALIGTLAGAATGGAVATLVERHGIAPETAERLAALLESDSAVLLSVEAPEERANEIEAALASTQALHNESLQAIHAGRAAAPDAEAYKGAFEWGYRQATHSTRTFEELEPALRDRYPGPYARDREAIRAGFERHRATIVRL